MNLTNIFWVLSSFFVSLLSILFHSQGPQYTGGIFYIIFTLLYGLVLFLSFKKFPNYFKGLSLIPFILGCFIVYFGKPLFENDHFRYLWEGKVLLKGLNPYILSPDSKTLSHITFSEKESIGFKYLPSIYPPLGLLFFSVGSFLSFKWNLLLQMIFNSIFVFYLFKMTKNKIKIPHLILLFPYFQKEFIQSIHIDLLAFLLILPILLNPHKLKTFNLGIKYLGFIFLTYWIKVIGILALPFVFLEMSSKNRTLLTILSILIVISLPLSAILFIGDLTQLKGALAFSKTWTWNPGFFSILNRVFGFSFTSSRVISLSIFKLLFLSFVFLFLKLLKKEKGDLNDRHFLFFIYLTFSSLMFFTPVYNPWYAIWFLVPALLIQNLNGILYGFFSCFSYISYGNVELRPLAEFLSHIWFILSLIEILKKDFPNYYLRFTFFIKGPFLSKKSG